MRFLLGVTFLIISVSSISQSKRSPGIIDVTKKIVSGSDSASVTKQTPSSLIMQTPYSFALRNKEMKKMMEAEHDADENIRKFQQNLEALKTTVEFEPVSM